MQGVELYTIGHSNHPLPKLLWLLQQHEICALVDIRRFPASRAFPHFNQQPLAGELAAHEIRYAWIESLGGRRSADKSAASPNAGLQNSSFRNYADYMRSDAFLEGVRQLTEIACDCRTAMMCAESMFWHCHRRLVSDFVVAQGGAVWHIFPDGQCQPHSLSDIVRVSDGVLTYPGPKTMFD